MSTQSERLISLIQEQIFEANPTAHERIEAALEDLKANPDRTRFFKLFALIPRWIGKGVHPIRSQKKPLWQNIHSCLIEKIWSVDQLARLWTLLAFQGFVDHEIFIDELETLFNTADTSELETLYACVPYLDGAEALNTRMREGARSNLYSVFLVVAHNNPFPAKYFDHDGWNQLILKAVFNYCPLAPIYDFDGRKNPELSAMLANYVRERWVAYREVPCDIWRGIAPFAGEVDALDLFKQALVNDKLRTRQGAALALYENPSEDNLNLLQAHSELLSFAESADWAQLNIHQ